MPKKTKKEKLLARYHKKLRLLENRQPIISPVQVKVLSEVSSMPPVENKIKISISEPLPQELKNTNQYFFSDLKKSLLLIFLILGLEVSLYFVKLKF